MIRAGRPNVGIGLKYPDEHSAVAFDDASGDLPIVDHHFGHRLRLGVIVVTIVATEIPSVRPNQPILGEEHTAAHRVDGRDRTLQEEAIQDVTEASQF